MLRGQPVTAVIPVRGGSKGVPGKNLRRVGGMSLLERAIRFAKAAPMIDRVLVSTDDPEMHDIASAFGVNCRALRPAALASDAATTASVVEHLIVDEKIESGHILILQATSPLRSQADLRGLCEAYLASEADAAVSLCALEEPRPEKLKRIEEGRILPYLGESFEGPRQALPQPYRLNGAFYLISREAFLREKRFLPQATLAYVMPAGRSHNLDSAEDFEILDAMLETGRWRLDDER
jgi:CMP-N,N'-diacetyllegionaminic acid synthase